MKLDRPIVFLDLETTGTDVAKARIVSIATIKIQPDGNNETREALINPGIPIPLEATKCHGIADTAVADKPKFRQVAKGIHAFLEGCDLGGYCLIDFDIPVLWEEFWRAGIEWDISGVRIADAGKVFKVKEARTLEAAVKFYLKRDHPGAHGALADATATRDVLFAQLSHYPDLPGDIAGLHEFCRDSRIDLAGKIVAGASGPEYAIGKAKGTRVIDDRGFGEWMLRQDFSEQTKQVLRRLLA